MRGWKLVVPPPLYKFRLDLCQVDQLPAQPIELDDFQEF